MRRVIRRLKAELDFDGDVAVDFDEDDFYQDVGDC